MTTIAPTNPSADQLAAMIASWSTDSPDCNRLTEAIEAARPTEPAALAMLLRWISEGDQHEIDRAILAHVADQLERQAGATILSGEAVAQIRAALVEAIERHGGSVEAAHEPGLAEDTRGFEAQMRGALALLSGMTAFDPATWCAEARRYGLRPYLDRGCLALDIREARDVPDKLHHELAAWDGERSDPEQHEENSRALIAYLEREVGA